MKKTRIVIADDHAVVRSGLRMLLGKSPSISIVAEAADGEEAVRLTGKLRPDLVIIDISMPKLDGIEATTIIREKHPDVKVIVLTVHEGEEYASRILRAGASGYLLKNANKREILDAITTAVSGGQFFSPGISRMIVEGFVRRARAETPAGGTAAGDEHRPLSKRELEVLGYIARGYTNKQIADALFLSFRTINTHRTNIMQKLGIHDTAGLVRHAIRLGLLEQST